MCKELPDRSEEDMIGRFCRPHQGTFEKWLRDNVRMLNGCRSIRKYNVSGKRNPSKEASTEAVSLSNLISLARHYYIWCLHGRNLW